MATFIVGKIRMEYYKIWLGSELKNPIVDYDTLGIFVFDGIYWVKNESNN